MNWNGRRTSRFLEDDEFNYILNNIEENFNINKYFDKIYCLNLNSKIENWKKVKYQFNKNNIHLDRFEAVDGIEIEDELFYIINKEVNPKGLRGELASRYGIIENKFSYACLLSHIKILKDAKDKGYKKILILEDDVIISDNFLEDIKNIKNINWKLIYLGCSQFDWKDISVNGGFYKSKNTLGTFAYGVDSSIFEELINQLEKKNKSVDNLLSEYQEKNEGCYTFFPNIVISNTTDSNIRTSKKIIDYAEKAKWNLSDFSKYLNLDINNQILKILLVPDVRGWAFDNIAKSIVKYNKSNNISYDITYVTDIEKGDYILDLNNFDYIYVLFEAERIIPDSKKIIRGCYSAFWIEDKIFSTKTLGRYFSNCKASIFANQYLKDSISPYLPENYSSTIIHDSADENLFYPIENIKNDKFTVIFVGNTKRKVKNFTEIEWICKESEVDLIVCGNIKNDDLVNYYNKADVCINFSTFEGGPQTFIESSLCSVPMLIRKNNELSKLIPCFTGETKEEFVQILKYLKNNRHLCEDMGHKARKSALNDFTYEKTSEKFARFFLQLEGIDYKENKKIKDLSSELTVFIISCGFNPNYEDCKMSLENQTVKFKLKEFKNISPMSKAFQKMIDDCDTDYYIQVDEDMILFEDTIEKIYNNLLSSKKNICIISHLLNDVHLNFDIHGIKGYKYKILKKYPYNLNIISCEMEQIERLKYDGFEIDMIESVLGLHSPKWSNELIFERYFDLMEKWKKYKYWWMEQVPHKLMNRYKEDPSEINLFALMGAICSISSEEPLRNREKNFTLEDKNFLRIKKLLKL
jgi:GR25 family glycosyltransferase involved in LPS biosynthesis